MEPNPEAEAMAQLVTLLRDREWRLDNLYMILDEGGRLVPFRARGEQMEFRRRRHYRNFVPKARKLGMSTEIVLENGDECIFTPNLVAGIIDKAENDAWAKLQIFRLAWENGPKHPNPGIAWLWMQIHEANPLKTDSNGEMGWDNGSKFVAGTSFTGRTPQRLHISEYGPIAAQAPKRAAEIQRGSINSVPPGGIVDIETTMEGGRFGLCYHYFQLAKEACGRDLSVADWRLHFFPWLGHPSYRLDKRRPTDADVVKYFADLRERYGVETTLEQQAWYEARKRELGDEMFQQYPTIIAEVDKATVMGAIYPEMTVLRSQGRVTKFNIQPGYPIYTAWDLGSSDNTAGWLIQPLGKADNYIDFSCGEGAGAAGVAEVIRSWERQYGPIAAHLLPHDAMITDKGSGLTYRKQLEDCGIPARIIRVVPRTPDVWVGIGEVRKRLPNSWFHERCDMEMRTPDGQKFPGGVGRLEGYRKHLHPGTNVTRSMPVKDNVCDHVSDAVRTWCEGHTAGMVYASTAEFSKPPQVKLYAPR